MRAPEHTDHRVLVVHNSYLEPGGEDLSVDDEVNLLAELGWLASHLRFTNEQFLADSTVIQRARQTMWNPAAAQIIVDAVRSSGANIVHFHNFFPAVSIAPHALVGSRCGVAVVQTLRNWRPLCPAGTLYRDGERCFDCVGNPLHTLRAVQHKCYRDSRLASLVAASSVSGGRLVKWSTRHVDAFICLTQFSAEVFRNSGLIPPDRVHVKPNFLGDVSPRSIREGNPVFIGRLTAEKGIHLLLRAWHSSGIPGALDIVGSGGQLAPTRNVRLLDRLEHADALELLSRARYLCFPSLWMEPFGRSIMEAMALGVPTLAVADNEYHPLVTDDVDGVLVRPDTESIIRGLRQLEDPTLRARLSRGARLTFERRFRRDLQGPILDEIYGAARKFRIDRSEGVRS